VRAARRFRILRQGSDLPARFEGGRAVYEVPDLAVTVQAPGATVPPDGDNGTGPGADAGLALGIGLLLVALAVGRRGRK